MLIAIIICEIISTLLLIYGFMHKEKLVQFEDKIKKAIKRDMRNIKIGLCVKCLKKEGFVVKKEGAVSEHRNN
jgi:hypothetical protein